MNKKIDCFFIGHNDMCFEEHEKNLRKMGLNSGAYRDLNLNFIWYGGKPYTALEIFNLFYCHDENARDPRNPVTMGEIFSPAIAYLGTYLHRQGLTFDYVNTFQEQKDQLAAKIQKENILTIAIITTLYVSIFPILEIVDFIKKYNSTANIIVGGPFIAKQIRTQTPEALYHCLQTINADFYVNSSQGEATLVNIIKALKTNSPVEGINNIHYKNHNGYVSTPTRRENNPLSKNMVQWDLFSSSLGKWVNARFSISCPFSCAFCGFPQHAGKYQTADTDAVEKELNWLDHHGIKFINFIDDTFNIPRKRFKQILKVMIKNRYRFRWNSHFRCQYADRETVELMKESGCQGVFLGIESGSNRILKNMNKAASVQEYLRGIALLKEYDIMTYGSFIVGFPGETPKTLNETTTFIKESQIDFFRTQLWYFESITPIWEQREKYGITGNGFEWSHNTMNSRKASNFINDIFLSVREPIWVPQYNFEWDTVLHLIHRGISWERIRSFINGFNQGIKEKLTNPGQQEISLEVIKQLKNACQDFHLPGNTMGEDKNRLDRYEAAFDF